MILSLYYPLAEAVSSHTLLIGYYHGLLVRDIDADLLTDKMFSIGLLTVDEQAVISSSHSVCHRNWLLLEYVRRKGRVFLSKFCELVREKWPQISSQLYIGITVHPWIGLLLDLPQSLSLALTGASKGICIHNYVLLNKLTDAHVHIQHNAPLVTKIYNYCITCYLRGMQFSRMPSMYFC